MGGHKVPRRLAYDRYYTPAAPIVFYYWILYLRSSICSRFLPVAVPTLIAEFPHEANIKYVKAFWHSEYVPQYVSHLRC